MPARRRGWDWHEHVRMAAVAASFNRDLEAAFARIEQLIDTARAGGVRRWHCPRLPWAVTW
ncbi:MAG TPA: hypothetical protein VHH52_06670 [Pseudonocardiaceae bacterium]|nr:hypothetical protein [Pseudonocardiaceae bacterium]